MSASDITSLALSKNSSQLFYILSKKDEVRVIDLNKTNPVSRLVLHWTSYNNIIRTIAVSGDYLFWTERTYSALWDLYRWNLSGGKIKNGVITSNNTWLVEHARGRRYAVYQLAAFEHDFPPSKASTPAYVTTPYSHANAFSGHCMSLLVSISVILKLVN